MISLNSEIRNFLGKNAGDKVLVTLFLHTSKSVIEKAEIFSCFKDAGVFNTFLSLPENSQSEIIEEIKAIKSPEKQTNTINHYIRKLETGQQNI